MKVFIYDNGLKLTNYIKAVNYCNSTPILSKDLSKIEDCDALLLTGGGNICPAFYGEKNEEYYEYDYLTDISEFYLIKEFLRKNKQIVGICKGMQVINVFFGGSLENISDKIIGYHYTFSKDINHEITYLNGNKLTVNSMHKQRVKRLGDNLKIEAISKDGTIEALSHKRHKVYGVQFHPERLSVEFCKNFYKQFFDGNKH